MKTRSFVALLALMPGVALAQQMPMSHPSAGVAAVKPVYDMFKDWIVKSAEQMPEANYSFKPTPDVRSFGQIIGHIANDQYFMCASIKGEANPNKTDFEKTTAKAGVVQGLKDSFTYCDAAYQMSDMNAMDEVTLFPGAKGSKLWALMFNASHDAEHYGNIITYFRLKGMVPPSSQQGM